GDRGGCMTVPGIFQSGYGYDDHDYWYKKYYRHFDHYYYKHYKKHYKHHKHTRSTMTAS
ncbi:MAG: hypothetical protein M3186_07705, partial [Actinomycetota bacterium]|nr:hypothetical protein [Actinomycetota bacterium]